MVGAMVGEEEEDDEEEWWRRSGGASITGAKVTRCSPFVGSLVRNQF